MEELQDIKVRMADIKLGQLEKTLNTISVDYLRTINQLRQKLKEKTQKQTLLTQQLQGLKQQCSDHNQEVKVALSKINQNQKYGRQIGSNRLLQGVVEKSPKMGFRHHFKHDSGCLQGFEKSSQKASTRHPPSTKNQISKKIEYKQRLQNSDKKVKNTEPLTFKKRYELLKSKSQNLIQLDQSKKGIRSSYDENKRLQKSNSGSLGQLLRKSEKLIKNPENRARKY